MRRGVRTRMSKADLRLDWCSYQAAKWAVEHWHYSRCLPASKSQYIGVWEGDNFVGCIVFGTGAGNITKGKLYGLPEMQMAELTRIALREHSFTVSRMVSIAIRMLKLRNPGIRLIVSLADPVRGHIGSIYQAGGWAFVGETSKSKTYIGKDDREYHERVVSPTGRKRQYGRYVPCLKPQDAKSIRVNPGKYKYLYPLDPAMRAQIEPLRKPYPKRGSGEIDNAANTNSQTGGASQTDPLLVEAA
jgi:hypothetical protein